MSFRVPTSGQARRYSPIFCVFHEKYFCRDLFEEDNTQAVMSRPKFQWKLSKGNDVRQIEMATFMETGTFSDERDVCKICDTAKLAKLPFSEQRLLSSHASCHHRKRWLAFLYTVLTSALR